MVENPIPTPATAGPTPAALRHLLFIDESGNGLANGGTPVSSIQSLWVSVGVALDYPQNAVANQMVRDIVKSRFRSRSSELKASELRRHLPPGVTASDIAADLAHVVSKTGAKIWVCSTRAGSRPMLALSTDVSAHKVRQLLLETVSGHASPRYYHPSSWLIIWDIGDVQDLMDFSSSLSTFRNRVSGYPLPTPVVPMMVGGLSHEWGGLQIADIFANFALHRLGSTLGLPDAKADRAAAFDKHLQPLLMKDKKGKLVGWKNWQ